MIIIIPFFLLKSLLSCRRGVVIVLCCVLYTLSHYQQLSLRNPNICPGPACRWMAETKCDTMGFTGCYCAVLKPD